MLKLLIATHNQGKFREIKKFLQDLDFELLCLKDLKIKEKVKETGRTFKENAIIKAKFYGEKAGLLTLADDSGLEVEVLGGQPGVKSSRYVQGSDKDRYEELLRKLKDIVWEKRAARFISVVAIFNPKKNKVSTFKGECEGRITFAPKGNKGFGYDPIFWSPDVNKTLGELSVEDKNRIDHRGRALKKVLWFLKEKLKNV